MIEVSLSLNRQKVKITLPKICLHWDMKCTIHVLTTMSSIGTGMNILGFSLGFWLMNRDTEYNSTIHSMDVINVMELVVGIRLKKSLYV